MSDLNNKFGNLFGSLDDAFGTGVPKGKTTGNAQFDATIRAAREDAKKPVSKPLPQIRGRHINGNFYVRAEDVADALESQAPVVNKRLISRLRKALGG